MAHDDVREQGYNNGRATPDGDIVVAAFAIVLVSVTWVGVTVALRVSGVVHVLDVLSEWLGPVACHGQIIMDRGWCLEEEGKSSNIFPAFLIFQLPIPRSSVTTLPTRDDAYVRASRSVAHKLYINEQLLCAAVG